MVFDEISPQPVNIMRKLFAVLSIACVFILSSCASENYSNGERIGMVTQFSKTGIFWKSWEGHLNMTQTGMNSSQAFDFSIDNDREDSTLVKMIDSAASDGWKVKIRYHEVYNKNWWGNRGHTDYFVTSMEILDRNPVGFLKGSSGTSSNTNSVSNGHTVDTIYVVIVGRASKP